MTTNDYFKEACICFYGNVDALPTNIEDILKAAQDGALVAASVLRIQASLLEARMFGREDVEDISDQQVSKMRELAANTVDEAASRVMAAEPGESPCVTLCHAIANEIRKLKL